MLLSGLAFALRFRSRLSVVTTAYEHHHAYHAFVTVNGIEVDITVTFINIEVIT